MTANVTTITSKGQVTIPKSVREALDIGEKDKLLFLVEGDRAIIIPVRKRPLDELYAALPPKRPYPGHDKVREAIQTELGERISRGEE